MTLLCTKADCLVGETGSCADGHDPLEACPNYVGEGDKEEDLEFPEDESGLEDKASATASRPVYVNLPKGEPLSSEDVDRFLRWRAARFITIIGDRDSGKTTLIYALYDRFLRGEYAGLSFAGSWTLIGLERRAHHSRVDSLRSTPDTMRTSLLEGLQCYHFAFASSGQPSKRVDLMLSDRSGESYREARNKTDKIDELVEVKQADRVVFLLDGGRVVDPVERNGALQAVRQTLRAFLDNGALGTGSVVQIVTTKIDLVRVSADKEEISASLDSFKKRITNDFGGRLLAVSFFDVAARDPTTTLPPAFGMETLLADWAQPPWTKSPIVSRLSAPLIREFDKLLTRTRAD